MIQLKDLSLHARDEVDNPTSWELSVDFLKYGIAAMSISACSFLIILHFVAPDQGMRGIGSIFFVLLGSIAWALMARGKIRLVVYLLAIGAWVIITAVSIVNGGVRTPMIAAYPLVILTAGWLISARSAWIASAFSIAATVGFILAEMGGILPMPTAPVAIRYGMVQIIIIVLSALLITFLVRAYHSRLVELRNTGNALTQRTLDLEISKAELQRAQAVATMGSWSYDITLNVIKLSEETCRIFGFPEGTTGSYDTYMTRVYPPDLSAVKQAWQAALNGQVFDHEHRILIGKSVRWIRQKAEIAYAPDGTARSAIGITQDITDRKRNEAELVAALSAAEAANNAKSRFLAAASHDLRQPIAALSLYVGVLENRVLPADVTLVDHIQECVRSLTVLLTDLLDISKLDAGAVTPMQSDFAIDDMLASLISVHAVEASIKGLRLSMRRSNAIVRTDRQLLLRMLGNLIVNAVHCTEHGGVLVACRRHEGKWWIEVWDTGVGIPASQTTIVFEEFRQLGDDARNRGSGLGLAIVAKAAQLLGLQIRLLSRVGRGSMFAIEVPIGRATATVERFTSPAPPGRARIALVEDNPQLLNALTMLLESEGHEVLAAATGHALMAQLGNKAPDVLISDYRLAEAQTGFEVIAMLRNTFGNELPAIIITGDTDLALVRSMADRGIAVHYKPLKIELLQAFIRESTEPLVVMKS